MKKFQHNQGFSIISVLIAMGLLGFILTVVMTNSSTLFYAQKKMASKRSFATVQDAIILSVGLKLREYLRTGNVNNFKKPFDVGDYMKMHFTRNIKFQDKARIQKHKMAAKTLKKIPKEVRQAMRRCSSPDLSRDKSMYFCMQIKGYTPQQLESKGRKDAAEYLRQNTLKSYSFANSSYAFAEFIVESSAATGATQTLGNIFRKEFTNHLAHIDVGLYWSVRTPKGVKKITNWHWFQFELAPK